MEISSLLKSQPQDSLLNKNKKLSLSNCILNFNENPREKVILILKR